MHKRANKVISFLILHQLRLFSFKTLTWYWICKVWVGTANPSSSSLSRMASPLWPSPCSRATTRWFLSYWRTILKERSGCRPCTSLPVRTTPSRPPCCYRTTTTLMSSQRYVHSTVWAAGGGSWHVAPHIHVSILWMMKNVPNRSDFNLFWRC